jgi:hypothetical protein
MPVPPASQRRWFRVNLRMGGMFESKSTLLFILRPSLQQLERQSERFTYGPPITNLRSAYVQTQVGRRLAYDLFLLCTDGKAHNKTSISWLGD